MLIRTFANPAVWGDDVMQTLRTPDGWYHVAEMRRGWLVTREHEPRRREILPPEYGFDVVDEHAVLLQVAKDCPGFAAAANIIL